MWRLWLYSNKDLERRTMEYNKDKRTERLLGKRAFFKNDWGSVEDPSIIKIFYADNHC